MPRAKNRTPKRTSSTATTSARLPRASFGNTQLLYFIQESPSDLLVNQKRARRSTAPDVPQSRGTARAGSQTQVQRPGFEVFCAVKRERAGRNVDAVTGLRLRPTRGSRIFVANCLSADFNSIAALQSVTTVPKIAFTAPSASRRVQDWSRPATISIKSLFVI